MYSIILTLNDNLAIKETSKCKMGRDYIELEDVAHTKEEAKVALSAYRKELKALYARIEGARK